MENSVSILITLEGEKEEIEKMLKQTKRRYSEYWPNE